jgi:hypothetical protein
MEKKATILDYLSNFLMFIIYMISRIIKAPLWFRDIERFAEWNQKTEWIAKDLKMVLIWAIVIPLFYFVPLKWIGIVLGAIVVILGVTIGTMYLVGKIRARRELNNAKQTK